MNRFSLSLVALFVGACFANASDAQEPSSESETVKRYIKRYDSRLDDLIDVNSPIEVLSTGHQWTEGPVWISDDQMLLFSDVPRNKIHRWKEGEGTSVFIDKSGYEGPSQAKEPGSNGLMLDNDGNLTVCDHGNHRVYRLEADGTRTTLIDEFEGKRFNSPNDLDIDKAGNIYFTDPPYGLGDPAKSELGFFGVYRLSPDGTVKLLLKDLVRPNGVALSPDEKTMYVAQSHKPAPVYMAYPIKDDGSVGEGKVLLDATRQSKVSPGMPDGMAVDKDGNLWATGPGGVLIISPDGRLLGHIMMGKKTANCTFGGDGSTLYMTSSDDVCRVKTKTLGRKYAQVDSSH
jgi:gluconolactonase